MDTPNDTALRRCRKCGIEYPATTEYFKKASERPMSIRYICKSCRNANERKQQENNREEYRKVRRELYANSAEKIRTHKREYYAATREIRRRYFFNWRLAHPGYKKEYSRLYNERNRDKTRERKRVYLKNHPEVVRTRIHRRRARLQGNSGTHRASDIRLQLRAQSDKKGKVHCWWCSNVIDGNAYHIDHRIPLARGGSNAPENLCIACPACNLSKHDKLPSEWNGRLL